MIADTEAQNPVTPLNALARENDALRAELERVKAERDAAYETAQNMNEQQFNANAKLSTALAALREIAEMSEAKGGHAKYGTAARRCLAEIEGEA